MFSSGEIADLEKKYSKYFMKKILKNILIVFAILIVLLVTLSAAYYILIYSNTKNKKTILIKKEKVIKQKNLKFFKIKKNSTILKESNKTSIILEKNISISSQTMMHEQNSSKEKNLETELERKIKKISAKQQEGRIGKLSFHIKPSNDLSFENSTRTLLKLNLVDNKKIAKSTKTTLIEEKNDTIKTQKQKVVVVTKTPKIKIEMQDIDSIRYLKNKYENTHNIIFALMLCEEFYSQKDYRSSLKWSIIANDIDNQSERSWIWFAKSKFKLGRKADAITALKAYLKTNESNTVRSLLKNIENGSLDD